MFDVLSSSDIANEISMTRSAFKGTVLVVEGTSDCRLYTKFIEKDKVRIIVAQSKNNVINAVSECRNRRGDSAVIGFVDRDMDSLLGKKHTAPIFMTDKRDMESSILSTSALEDVLSEYGDTEKIRSFEEKYGSVRDAVLKAASPVGILMYLSYRKGMNLSFKDIDHSLFVDPRSLRTDLSKLVTTIYSGSMGQMFSKAAVTDQLKTLLNDIGASWDVCRGHDAVSVLRIGLRHSFGSYNARSMTDGELGGALRLAYAKELFIKSRLYSDSGKWCKEHDLELWIA